MWTIDLAKASELAFEALLTGIISALTIFITYRLGIRQADRSWKRELARRDREDKEQAFREITRKRIEILRELIAYTNSYFEQKILFDEMPYSGSDLSTKERDQIRLSILKATSLFQNNDKTHVIEALEKLGEIIWWDKSAQVFDYVPSSKLESSKPIIQFENENRISFTRNTFLVFEQELQALEKLLQP